MSLTCWITSTNCATAVESAWARRNSASAGDSMARSRTTFEPTDLTVSSPSNQRPVLIAPRFFATSSNNVDEQLILFRLARNGSVNRISFFPSSERFFVEMTASKKFREHAVFWAEQVCQKKDDAEDEDDTCA